MFPKLVQYTIGYHLEYKDLISFSLTCKKFWQMFSDDYFWKAKLSLITPVTLQNTLAEYKSFKDLGRAVYNQVIRFKDKKPYRIFEGDVDSDEYYLPILDCKNVAFGRQGFYYIDRDGITFASTKNLTLNTYIPEKALRVQSGKSVGILSTNHNLYIRNGGCFDDELEKIADSISRFAISLGHIIVITRNHHLLIASRNYPKKFYRYKFDAVDVAAGDHHLLYLDRNGHVYGCKQLDFDCANPWIPIADNVSKIYANGNSSAFIMKNGDLFKEDGNVFEVWNSKHYIDSEVSDVALGLDMMAILKRNHDLYFMDELGKNFVMSNVWQVSVYQSDRIIALGFPYQELKPLLVTLNNMARVSIEDGEEIEEELDYSNFRTLFEKYSNNLYSLLFNLIENNHYCKATLTLAIEFGLDINLQHPIFSFKSLRGLCTPLTSAGEFLDIEIVQTLLEHGVDIKLRDSKSFNIYESILTSKISPQHISNVEALLALLAKYDARPCIRSNIDFMLRSSAEYKVYWNSEIIRKFLENADIDRIIG